MIQINKSKTVPDISVYKAKRWSLDGKKMTLAKRDLIKSINFYADTSNFKNNKKLTKKSFKYEAYSHKDTKKVLKEVFNGKCAYCESFIMHIEPGDIEHFRPKAEIHTKDGDELIPGYYWLGANWNNLLLSCIKCNRSNNEAINVPDGIIQNMGKANHFPLLDETKRIRSHTEDVSNEDTFVGIINPCVEDPNDHLIFEDNGQITALDEKGENSIEVYGLFRADLVYKRNKASEELDRNLISLTEAVKALELLSDNGLPIDNILIVFKTQKEKLEFSFHKDAEYLGLKRQKLRRFKNQNPISYQKLQDLGVNLDDLFNA